MITDVIRLQPVLSELTARGTTPIKLTLPVIPAICYHLSMSIDASKNLLTFVLLGLSCLMSCGCASMSDPGTIHRPTPSPISIEDLPQLVSEQIELDRDDTTITRVLKWGHFPNHWFEIELESGSSLKYNPNGSILTRVQGGIL